MKKFEYMRVAFNRGVDLLSLETQLNNIGNDGWEAFHVQLEAPESLYKYYQDVQVEYWYFKREKQQ